MKLTKKEIIEIEKLISYYDSLDLDVYGNKEFPHSERDTLNGLIKLMKHYKSSFNRS